MKNFSFWLKAIALPVALLSVGSVVVLATTYSNNTLGTKERCDELYRKIYTSDAPMAAPAYTADEKAEYLKYCVNVEQSTNDSSTDQSVYSCDEIKKIIESGQYTDDQKLAYLQCFESVTSPPTQYPSATCDELARLIKSGQYTEKEKALYAQCIEDEGIPFQGEDDETTIAAQCESWMTMMKKLSQMPNSSEYLNAKAQYNKLCVQEPTQIREQARTRCEELRLMLEKLSADPNSKDYSSVKAKYIRECYAADKLEQGADAEDSDKVGESADHCRKLKRILESGQYQADDKALFTKLCLNEKPVVPENRFCEKMKLLLESGDGYTADDKLIYYKVCLQKTATPAFAPEADRCKALRSKMITYNQQGLVNTPEYAQLKNEFIKLCEKAKVAPPAGFEDEVLVNPDAYNNPFPDTDAGNREGKAAAELYRRGVLGGFPDGEFKGERPVNRAEAAKFLLLACGKDTQADYSGKFRDLMKGQWYVPYVEVAAQLGIIKGYEDGTFRPANTVNRAEFSKMITLACQLPENLDYSLFTDVKEGDWFAVYAGAVQKYSLYPDSVVDNLFKPANLMTRSEVAIAIYQYLTNR